MSIYTPYFYIIQNIRNNMYYAGARWANGRNPDELLKENGYITSSKIIKKIIDDSGLDTFVIRKIRTFETSDEACDYETKFLVKVDAKRNPRFYNGHNNDGKMNVIKMKKLMTELYGVDNPMKSDQIKEKVKQTNMEKYGVEYPTQSEIVRKKVHETNLKNLGVEYPTQSEKVMNSQRKTNLQKYGVENVFQSEDIKEKIKQTNIRKYGTDNYAKTDESKMKMKNTFFEKYNGFMFQSEELTQKYKNTLAKNYSVEHPMHSEEIKDRVKKTNMEKYGVENSFQSESAKIKIKKRIDYLLSRPQLDQIRAYQKKYKLKFGCGWVRKPDDFIENLLKDLVEKYGEI